MKEKHEDAGGAYRDRSFGLVVFGVIEILMGGFCALLVPLSVAAWWLSRGAPNGGLGLGATIPMLVAYAAFAVALISLGIGSIRARRWACDLMLSLSRIWLLTGICTLLVVWILLPGLMRSMAVAEGLPPEFLFIATAVTLAIVSFIYVLLPGAFMLFYRSPDVAATCRARDVRPQFTDNCPQRVLTLAVVWALAGISVLTMPAYNWVFPFFGRLLAGAAGVIPWIAVLIACLALAWGSCQLRGWAWWGGVALTVVALVATVLTSIRVSPGDLLTTLQLPDEQLTLMLARAWPSAWVVSLGWVVVWGSMVAYLLTVRRYFGVLRPHADG